MNLFALFQLWLATTLCVNDTTSTSPPPPSSHATESEEDDGESRPWLGFFWDAPSINNGY
ncbi:MAG: hypothetical protein ACI8S6_005707 [Myxococcota bacterium]